MSRWVTVAFVSLANLSMRSFGRPPVVATEAKRKRFPDNPLVHSSFPGSQRGTFAVRIRRLVVALLFAFALAGCGRPEPPSDPKTLEDEMRQLNEHRDREWNNE